MQGGERGSAKQCQVDSGAQQGRIAEISASQVQGLTGRITSLVN